MSLWRRTAVERIPSLSKLISRREIDNPMMLWIELNMEFGKALSSQPVNEVVIRQIWNYAMWCLAESHNQDVQTAVALGFVEHLLDSPKQIEWLPKLMSRSELLGFKSLLLVHNSEADFDRALKIYIPSSK